MQKCVQNNYSANIRSIEQLYIYAKDGSISLVHVDVVSPRPHLLAQAHSAPKIVAGFLDFSIGGIYFPYINNPNVILLKIKLVQLVFIYLRKFRGRKISLCVKKNVRGVWLQETRLF